MIISYKRLIKLEKPFSRNMCNGGGREHFKIESGTIPILVSAPHSVNHYRDSSVKKADLYTGGIARYLHELTSCHVIYSSRYSETDPNNDPSENSEYKKRMGEYVKEHDIRLVIDLHGASADRPYAVEMGTIDDEDTSLCNHKFIDNLINDVFVKELADIESAVKDVQKNVVFNAKNPNTVTSYVSSQLGIPAIQLEINGLYRDPVGNPVNAETTISCLAYIINTLSKINWDAKIISSYNVVFMPKRPRPINKIEFVKKGEFEIETGDIFNMFSNTKVVMGARANTEYQDEWTDPPDSVYKSDTIYVTHFLIEQLYGLPPNECKMLPIVLCSSERMTYEVGVSKIDSIDSVKLSLDLYEKMVKETDDHYLVLYNKYSDSHLALDPSNMNYGSKVRTKNGDGCKVMMPRYFRSLMRFDAYPLPIIREEEYSKLLAKLDPEQETSFTHCYEKSKHSPYYILRNNIDSDAENDLIKIQWNELALNETIDLIRVPKKYIDDNLQTDFELTAGGHGKKDAEGSAAKKKTTGRSKKEKRYSGVWNKIAKIFVGESEHPMSVTWGNTIDDKNEIARMNKVGMGLLGVVENDVVLVKYKGHEQKLKVLEWDELEDYQISISAVNRKKMEMNNINDVVKVKRYSIHAFKRTSHAQFLAVLGALITVFCLLNGMVNLVLSILISIAVIPVGLFFILIEERVRVK